MQGRPFPYDVKTTADHWWPKGLQRLWRDQAGFISIVGPSGETKSQKPPKQGSGKKGFAQIRGGHRMYFGRSPWNHTFEPDFSEIDNQGPIILRELREKLRIEGKPSIDQDTRKEITDGLVKLCFSLMIRSPAFRHRYSHAGIRFGLGFNPETGKSNVQHFWKSAKDIDLQSCNSGVLLLLYSNGPEFCFGDGLCDTIFTKPIGWRQENESWIANITGEAIVPLLPNLCAYLQYRFGSLGTSTNITAVDYSIVNKVNSLTQIYSKEQLFFRSIKPNLTLDFLRNEHLRFTQVPSPLIPELKDFFDEKYLGSIHGNRNSTSY